MLPVLLRKGIERCHPFPVMIQQFSSRLVPLPGTPDPKDAFLALRFLLGLGVRYRREHFLGSGLVFLLNLIEHVDDAVVPAALLLCLRVNVRQSSPDAQMAVA